MPRGATAADRPGLTLYVPGLLPDALLGAEAGALARLAPVPLLDRWLARGDRQPAGPPAAGHEHRLFALFGAPLPGDSDPPVGALRHQRTGHAPAGRWCICADPVHLRADINNVVLFDLRGGIDASRGPDPWIPGVRAWLADQGFSLEDAGGGCWYLHTDVPQQLRTHALSAVQNQPLGDRLPQGPDRGRWLRLLNEIQMILNQSPVPDSPVNSLWFWGGGQLPALPAGRYHRVWADDATALDLGRVSGARVGDLGEGRRRCLQPDCAGSRQLVVFHDLLAATAGADLHDWEAGLGRLQQEWLDSLESALREGRVAFVDLTDGPQTWRISRRGLRRWWRRPRGFLSSARAVRDRG